MTVITFQPGVTPAEELYDALMADIEPELTRASAAGLDEKYKGESAEGKQSRLARYRAAFVRFQDVAKQLMGSLGEVVHRQRRLALKEQEAKSRREEESFLKNLEARFLTGIAS